MFSCGCWACILVSNLENVMVGMPLLIICHTLMIHLMRVLHNTVDNDLFPNILIFLIPSALCTWPLHTDMCPCDVAELVFIVSIVGLFQFSGNQHMT